MPQQVTTATFRAEVLESDKPVLVDFWAAWCGPCRMLAPVIDELEAEQAGIKVCKVNIDDNPELAQQYGVMSIPTVILFRNGQVDKQLVGVRPKEDFEQLLK